MPSQAERVRAAVEAARRLRIPVHRPRVLADGYNLIVHLAPAPVVARVATLFPGDGAEEAAHWRAVAAREVALAVHLLRCGVPTVGPPDMIDPGPHACAQTCFTLWKLVQSRPEIPPTPAEFVALLSTLTLGLATFPQPLPKLGAWRQTPRPSPDAVDPAAAAWLDVAWATLDERLADLPAEDLVAAHGDAHVGNLLWSELGWVWADFEDGSRMPRHWDLACATFRGVLLGEHAEWAEQVIHRALGETPERFTVEAVNLAVGARALQSVTGALALATSGVPADGDAARRRLPAVRALLHRMGLVPSKA